MGQHEQWILNEVCNQVSKGFHTKVKLTNSQLSDLCHLLNTAVDNDSKNKTEFPDFLCNGGWIEHFSVTFGPILDNGGYKNCQIEQQAFKNATQSVGENNRIIYPSTEISAGSYKNFETSLRRAWEKHIIRFHKSGIDPARQTGVFLIEVDDSGIILHISDEQGINHRSCYSMGLDEQSLDFIYQSRGIVKYVIVYITSLGCCEVIALDDVPLIKKTVLKNMTIRFDPVEGINNRMLFKL